MRIDVITLFPAIFPGPLAESIPGRALERGLAELHAHDLRQWGIGRHRSVDDYTYGGGAGMVLRPEPIADALDVIAPAPSGAFRILLDPGGERLEQRRSRISPHGHISSSCVRATKASMTGSARSSISSCRSATTSSRVVRSRACRHRLGAASVAGCHRCSLDRRGILRARTARVPAVHAPAHVPRHRRPAGPGEWRPRGRGRLAASGSARAHPPAAPRPAASGAGRTRLSSSPARACYTPPRPRQVSPALACPPLRRGPGTMTRK